MNATAEEHKLKVVSGTEPQLREIDCDPGEARKQAQCAPAREQYPMTERDDVSRPLPRLSQAQIPSRAEARAKPVRAASPEPCRANNHHSATPASRGGDHTPHEEEDSRATREVPGPAPDLPASTPIVDKIQSPATGTHLHTLQQSGKDERSNSGESRAIAR